MFLQASLLYEACSVIEKARPCRSLDNSCVENGFPLLLTPLCGLCSMCNRTITEHNRPIDVLVYGLCVKANGLKFCLRCDPCDVNYNYD